MPHWLPHRPLPIYHYLIQFQLVPGSGLFYEETNVVQEYSSSIQILPLPQPFPGRIIDRSTKGFTYLHQQIGAQCANNMRSQSPGQSEAGFLLWPPCLVDRD